MPAPTQRYRHGGLASRGSARGAATLPGATLGLSSQDVAGARTDASTGRRTFYVQRTVEGSLSLTLRRPPARRARARDRERYAVTYDAAGRPVDLMVMTTGIYRGSFDLPAACSRRSGCCRSPTGHVRTYVEETHLDLTDPESLRLARRLPRAGPPSGPRSVPAPRSRSPPPCAGAWTTSAWCTRAPTTPTSGATASTARWASRACKLGGVAVAHAARLAPGGRGHARAGRGLARARGLPGAGGLGRPLRACGAARRGLHHRGEGVSGGRGACGFAGRACLRSSRVFRNTSRSAAGGWALLGTLCGASESASPRASSRRCCRTHSTRAEPPRPGDPAPAPDTLPSMMLFAPRSASAIRAASVLPPCEHAFACRTSSSTATPPSPSWTAPRCPTSWWPPPWSAGTPRWRSPTTTRSRARWSSRRRRATWGACAPSTARR